MFGQTCSHDIQQYKYFVDIKHTKMLFAKACTYIKQRYQGNNLPEAIGGIEFSSNVNYEMSPCHHRCMALALHRCRQGVNLPTDIGQIY